MKVEPSANLYPHKIQQAGIFQDVIFPSLKTQFLVATRHAFVGLF